MNLDRRLIVAMGVVIGWVLSTSLGHAQALPEPILEKLSTSLNESATKQPLRPIRVAVFDFDVLEGVDLQPAALTDQVNTALEAMDEVTIVNRDQIAKVADEHKLTLSGVVEGGTATKLGKFLSANYVIVGRASHIGQTNYIVTKVIDVNTTVQSTVAAKVPAEKGVEALVEKLTATLEPQIRELQKPLPKEKDATLAKLRKAAKPLVGKVVVVDVAESHVNRPLPDPAAQMAIAKRLKDLGMIVISPKDPPQGWKQSLLETGRYGDRKVDFLFEGEGLSAFAANVQGMISCRARVELRLVPLPGKAVTVTDRGVAAHVDLVEALAAKAALEEAGTNASDALILQYSKYQPEKK